jgi:hypothetical protein
VSVQAELVAFGVAHDVGERAAVVMGGDQFGAEPGQAGSFIRLAAGLDVDVDVNTVLRDLAFGHALEEQPRLGACRVAACRDDPERDRP